MLRWCSGIAPVDDAAQPRASPGGTERGHPLGERAAAARRGRCRRRGPPVAGHVALADADLRVAGEPLEERVRAHDLERRPVGGGARRRPRRLPSGRRTSTGTRRATGSRMRRASLRPQAQRRRLGAAGSAAGLRLGRRGHRTLSSGCRGRGTTGSRREPEPDAVPADEQADPLGHQAVPAQRAGAAAREVAGTGVPRGGRGQHALAVAVEADADGDAVGRQAEPDVVPAGDVVERRDVERLVDRGAAAARRGRAGRRGARRRCCAPRRRRPAALPSGRRHQKTESGSKMWPRTRALASIRTRSSASSCDAAACAGTARRRRGCRRRGDPVEVVAGVEAGEQPRRPGQPGQGVEVDEPLVVADG